MKLAKEEKKLNEKKKKEKINAKIVIRASQCPYAGADPGFCLGGWLGGSKKFFGGLF